MSTLPLFKHLDSGANVGKNDKNPLHLFSKTSKPIKSVHWRSICCEKKAIGELLVHLIEKDFAIIAKIVEKCWAAYAIILANDLFEGRLADMHAPKDTDLYLRR